MDGFPRTKADLAYLLIEQLKPFGITIELDDVGLRVRYELLETEFSRDLSNALFEHIMDLYDPLTAILLSHRSVRAE